MSEEVGHSDCEDNIMTIQVAVTAAGRMSLPADINSSETTFTMVADGVNSVWVICGGTGQVWKGRINRVAWKQEDKYFEE